VHQVGGATAAVLVDPTASAGIDVERAPGCVLMAGSRVTTNVRLGSHSYLNVNAVVSHDCRIGRFVSISPGALVNGGVTLEDGCFIGPDSQLVAPSTIGKNAYVGTGTTVTKSVPEDALAISRPKQENKLGYASRLRERMRALAEAAKREKAEREKAEREAKG